MRPCSQHKAQVHPLLIHPHQVSGTPDLRCTDRRDTGLTVFSRTPRSHALWLSAQRTRLLRHHDSERRFLGPLEAVGIQSRKPGRSAEEALTLKFVPSIYSMFNCIRQPRSRQHLGDNDEGDDSEPRQQYPEPPHLTSLSRTPYESTSRCTLSSRGLETTSQVPGSSRTRPPNLATFCDHRRSRSSSDTGAVTRSIVSTVFSEVFARALSLPDFHANRACPSHDRSLRSGPSHAIGDKSLCRSRSEPTRWR